MPYAPPSVTITSTGPQTPVLTGPPPKTIMLLADFPKGPDYPSLVAPVQMASLYGDPTVAATAGYKGPYMAYFASQQQAPGGGPVQFLVCRAGVTRGQYVVPDVSAATCFTLSAIGAYAGSASQYLQLKLTVASSHVTTISFQDSRTSTPVGTPLADTAVGGAYDLTTNAKCVAAINATNPLGSLGSVCVATAGASSVVPVAIGTYTAFTTGTDGKGVAYNDSTIGTSGSGGLLDQSLWTAADYIVAGFDAATIGATLLSHVSTAASQNNYRKIVPGAVAGTTFASLTGSYLGSPLQSSRFWPCGHDSLSGVHPATGALTAWDGWYGAAALAALKASAPTQETLINFPLAGFTGVNPPSDKPAGLQYSDLNTLAAAGFTVLYTSAQDPALRVRDTLTSAPQTINGTSQQNQYSYWNIQDIDDAVAAATVRALAPFKGRPMAIPEATANLMHSAVTSAISGLGPITNGINGDGTRFVQDPTTGNITGTVSYKTRPGIRTIPVSIGFTT